MGTDFLAPPPFRPDDAMQALKRDLRGLGLAERAGFFERRGIAIARVTLDGSTLQAARVKRPTRASPEWQASTLRSSADTRGFVADLKLRLAQWSDSDE
jgi:hypothetical protein